MSFANRNKKLHQKCVSVTELIHTKERNKNKKIAHNGDWLKTKKNRNP